jgi:hypothetical protein
VPSPVGRRRSLRRVATAGVLRHRPRRLAARRLRGAGQVGWGVSPAVALASLRRSLAAPCRPGLPASGPSRSGVGCDTRGTQAARRIALAVFLPRVSGGGDIDLAGDRARVRPSRVVSRRGGDAARAGHSCLVFFGQRTFRARARAGSRGLAGGGGFPPHRRRPWDLLITLRSVAPTARVGAPSSASRPGPPAVSPSRPTASSIDRGIRLLVRFEGPSASTPGFSPRGPAFATLPPTSL